MGTAPVRFDGKDLYQPGYYGKRDISSLNVGAASGSRLLLIGECKGGVPYDKTTDFPNADDRVNPTCVFDEKPALCVVTQLPITHKGVTGGDEREERISIQQANHIPFAKRHVPHSLFFSRC